MVTFIRRWIKYFNQSLRNSLTTTYNIDKSYEEYFSENRRKYFKKTHSPVYLAFQASVY